MADAEDKAILADLERESKEFDKDAEIDRILKAFRLNAYAILNIQPGLPDSDIIKVYRKKSLLIHPDKTHNPLAPDAFDRLAKAHQLLLDEKQRSQLDEAIADARRLIIRERKWTLDEPTLREEGFWRGEWQERTKAVLIEEELRRRRQAKAQMQEEGREQRRLDEEMEERKRKEKEKRKWEDTREERIGSWRDFQKKATGGKSETVSTGGGGGGGGAGGGGGGEKKKKKKLKVLG